MKIIACVKQVIDPEAPLSSFKIDPVTKRAVPPAGTPPVISPYDENALEAALQLKDANADVTVSVLSVGNKLAAAVLQKGLAVGGADLFLVDDEACDDLDGFSSVAVLAAAIKKIGGADVVVCGRQASDSDAGQVGSGLAEIMGCAVVTMVKKIEKAGDGKLKVERVLENGHEVVEVSTPCVLTVSNEVGDLRFPGMKDIMAAKKKPTTKWKAADLGLGGADFGASVAKVKLVDLFIPKREIKCEIVSADTLEEAGALLASKLREAKII